MNSPEQVAVVVLWRGGAELVMEERWVDVGYGKQETRYAFPGGKVEDGEEIVDAAVREVREETGVVLQSEDLRGHEVVEVGNTQGHIFQGMLLHGEPLGDGSIVVWTIHDLLEHKKKGRLMPLTNEFVERHF